MDDIMLGIRRRDYALHSRHFSVNLKSRIDAENFLKACDEQEADWGSSGERILVCVFRKEKSFTVIWEQRFSHSPGQVLAMVTVALKGGRYFVDYFLLH